MQRGAQLSGKPGADRIPVTIGDMTAARVPGAPPGVHRRTDVQLVRHSAPYRYVWPSEFERLAP